MVINSSLSLSFKYSTLFLKYYFDTHKCVRLKQGWLKFFSSLFHQPNKAKLRKCVVSRCFKAWIIYKKKKSFLISGNDKSKKKCSSEREKSCDRQKMHLSDIKNVNLLLDYGKNLFVFAVCIVEYFLNLCNSERKKTRMK
jgi:hypothetical protein